MISHQNIESKSKIGLVFREDQSGWVSCQSINASLIRAYKLIADTDIFNAYSRQKTSFDLINEIIDKNVTVLVFADHQVRPIELLNSEKLRDYITRFKVKVIFHIYGCYMDRLTEYFKIGQLLHDQDVRFIAASPRHQNLIQKTIVDTALVHCVPFPMDTDLFMFSEAKRKSFRQMLNINDETSLFIYTGRISNFKNVELAMTFLAKQVETNKKIKFLYIGEFDNLGSYQNFNYIGKSSQVNAQLLKALDPRNEWCHYQHFVQSDQLANYLCAADAFISLSVFPSDDFGVSVAEAKSSGLPCFLTDWGGLSGFKSVPINYYAKVTAGDDDLFIDLDYLATEIHSFKNLTPNQRILIGKAMKKSFGIDFIATELAKVVFSERSHMTGIDSRLVLRCELATKKNFEMIFELKDVYDSYWT